MSESLKKYMRARPAIGAFAPRCFGLIKIIMTNYMRCYITLNKSALNVLRFISDTSQIQIVSLLFSETEHTF